MGTDEIPTHEMEAQAIRRMDADKGIAKTLSIYPDEYNEMLHSTLGDIHHFLARLDDDAEYQLTLVAAVKKVEE
jgi:hypothetical protein